ncbi:MAG: FHA domain-containing protein [Bacillota bacterium]|nr:FHA domain-containing protein [Bacillota bacterium]
MEGSEQSLEQDETAEYVHRHLSLGDKIIIILTLVIIVASVLTILIIMNKVSERVLLKVIAGLALLDSLLISIIIIRNNRAVKALSSFNKTYLVNSVYPQGDKLFINKKAVKIGRLSEGTNFCIRDPMVSKVHAEIRKKRSKYYIIDLNSTNGTYVNGRRLKRGSRRRLVSGDTLKFGEMQYKFISRV